MITDPPQEPCPRSFFRAGPFVIRRLSSPPPITTPPGAATRACKNARPDRPRQSRRLSVGDIAYSPPSSITQPPSTARPRPPQSLLCDSFLRPTSRRTLHSSLTSTHHFLLVLMSAGRNPVIMMQGPRPTKPAQSRGKSNGRRGFANPGSRAASAAKWSGTYQYPRPWYYSPRRAKFLAMGLLVRDFATVSSPKWQRR